MGIAASLRRGSYNRALMTAPIAPGHEPTRQFLGTFLGTRTVENEAQINIRERVQNGSPDFLLS
jgi:hypothetical protein